jgi:hypothetical protein
MTKLDALAGVPSRPDRGPGPLRGVRLGVLPGVLAGVLLVMGPGMATDAAAAGPPEGKPLRSDHPIIGAWALRADDSGCTEIYRISREGTSLVTSADEVAQTRFEVSDKPSAKGYYKWVDTIVKDNGKKDCSGKVTKPHTTTSYILMNETNKAFISCQNESTKACIGPFMKIEGGEI